MIISVERRFDEGMDYYLHLDNISILAFTYYEEVNRLAFFTKTPRLNYSFENDTYAQVLEICENVYINNKILDLYGIKGIFDLSRVKMLEHYIKTTKKILEG